ncbi:LysR family transcriptional regulator, partial [Lelliottia amnigena]|nr:LysR family transcriptional regulator [Lelliottia amnigena]
LVPRMYVENELSCGMLVSSWPASECLSKKFCLVKPTETGINEATLESFERWLLTEIKTCTSTA